MKLHRNYWLSSMTKADWSSYLVFQFKGKERNKSKVFLPLLANLQAEDQNHLKVEATCQMLIHQAKKQIVDLLHHHFKVPCQKWYTWCHCQTICLSLKSVKISVTKNNIKIASFLTEKPTKRPATASTTTTPSTTTAGTASSSESSRKKTRPDSTVESVRFHIHFLNLFNNVTLKNHLLIGRTVFIQGWSENKDSGWVETLACWWLGLY